MPTNYPKKGEDMKISLANSKYPQFDRAWAEKLRKEHPDIWKLGGNTRGNTAFLLWGRAKEGKETASVLEWIREREAWAARHLGDFRLPGVIAQIKWGVIGSRGEAYMKKLIREKIKDSKEISKKATLPTTNLPGNVQKTPDNSFDRKAYVEELYKRWNHWQYDRWPVSLTIKPYDLDYFPKSEIFSVYLTDEQKEHWVRFYIVSKKEFLILDMFGDLRKFPADWYPTASITATEIADWLKRRYEHD